MGLAVLLDVTATALVIRSTVATPLQKVLQLLLTWAVPFVGSIFVIAVVRETMGSPRSRLEPGAGDIWLPGIGPDSGSHHTDHSSGSDVGNGGDAGGH